MKLNFITYCLKRRVTDTPNGDFVADTKHVFTKRYDWNINEFQDCLIICGASDVVEDAYRRVYLQYKAYCKKNGYEYEVPKGKWWNDKRIYE